MKKRLMSIIMVVVMAFTLVACQASKPEASKPEASKPEASKPAEKTLDYPKKPITLIVPWAAGGSSDLTCRAIAALSQKYLGTAMNVVNREGGNGAVALTEMANKIKPDGYTISLSSAGNFTTMPFVQDVNYTIDSFKYLIGTTSEPLAVIVRKDSELNSLQDIVKRGTKVLHGQSGSNGANHMHSKRLFKAMGVEEEIVPFSGASTAIAALLGGQVEMILVHPGMVMSSIESGEVKLISMIYNERVPTFPDVKTPEEEGFGKIHAETYKNLLVHADTDPKIIEFLTEKLDQLMRDPQFLDFLKNNGLERSYYKGEEVKKVMQADSDILVPMMKELGIIKK
ncbi:MAG: tripartite tricarboxylate transporter substrate binding protein [Clostridia bacterium]